MLVGTDHTFHLLSDNLKLSKVALLPLNYIPSTFTRPTNCSQLERDSS